MLVSIFVFLLIISVISVFFVLQFKLCIVLLFVEEGRCMRGSDGKLCLSEKDGGNVWNDYMLTIMK